mmetsp:Transcript_6207/g.5637  ORF Transcript_6207/g.5637 Transcript_6207/m.5637 type:complete len:310 (+) Transcript_6207:801-1730(+)
MISTKFQLRNKKPSLKKLHTQSAMLVLIKESTLTTLLALPLTKRDLLIMMLLLLMNSPKFPKSPSLWLVSTCLKTNTMVSPSQSRLSTPQDLLIPSQFPQVPLSLLPESTGSLPTEQPLNLSRRPLLYLLVRPKPHSTSPPMTSITLEPLLVLSALLPKTLVQIFTLNLKLLILLMIMSLLESKATPETSSMSKSSLSPSKRLVTKLFFPLSVPLKMAHFPLVKEIVKRPKLTLWVPREEIMSTSLHSLSLILGYLVSLEFMKLPLRMKIRSKESLAPDIALLLMLPLAKLSLPITEDIKRRKFICWIE